MLSKINSIQFDTPIEGRNRDAYGYHRNWWDDEDEGEKKDSIVRRDLKNTTLKKFFEIHI